MTDERYNTTILCEKAKFSISGQDGEDFTRLPVVEQSECVTISQFTLKEMVRQTIFAIAANENNRLMTGELLEIKNNIMQLCSLDGHRIAIRRVELKESYTYKKVIIPGKSLNEISKIVSGETDKDVSIFFSENHVMFVFDDTMVVSRLIEGEYFRIDHMLSSDYETKVIINKKEFASCIDRAALLVREGEKNSVVVNVTDNMMQLSIHSQLGSMNEEIAVQKEGQDILIGFNPKFLLDALRVIDDETISVYMVNPKAPCFIRDDQESYIYLVLPININAGR